MAQSLCANYSPAPWRQVGGVGSSGSSRCGPLPRSFRTHFPHKYEYEYAHNEYEYEYAHTREDNNAHAEMLILVRTIRNLAGCRSDRAAGPGAGFGPSLRVKFKSGKARGLASKGLGPRSTSWAGPEPQAGGHGRESSFSRRPTRRDLSLDTDD